MDYFVAEIADRWRAAVDDEFARIERWRSRPQPPEEPRNVMLNDQGEVVLVEKGKHPSTGEPAGTVDMRLPPGFPPEHREEFEETTGELLGCLSDKHKQAVLNILGMVRLCWRKPNDLPPHSDLDKLRRVAFAVLDRGGDEDPGAPVATPTPKDRNHERYELLMEFSGKMLAVMERLYPEDGTMPVLTFDQLAHCWDDAPTDGAVNKCLGRIEDRLADEVGFYLDRNGRRVKLARSE